MLQRPAGRAAALLRDQAARIGGASARMARLQARPGGPAGPGGRAHQTRPRAKCRQALRRQLHVEPAWTAHCALGPPQPRGCRDLAPHTSVSQSAEPGCGAAAETCHLHPWCAAARQAERLEERATQEVLDGAQARPRSLPCQGSHRFSVSDRPHGSCELQNSAASGYSRDQEPEAAARRPGDSRHVHRRGRRAPERPRVSAGGAGRGHAGAPAPPPPCRSHVLQCRGGLEAAA